MIPVIPKWGKPKKEPRVVHHHLGIRNEVVRDDEGYDRHITVRVVGGVGGAASGEYKVGYTEGMNLGRYLSRLKLKRIAAYSAVYDQTNLENGRCRMTYVPQPGAKITVGPSQIGSATAHQRSGVDAVRVATRMGGGAKVVERKM